MADSGVFSQEEEQALILPLLPGFGLLAVGISVLPGADLWSLGLFPPESLATFVLLPLILFLIPSLVGVTKLEKIALPLWVQRESEPHPPLLALVLQKVLALSGLD